MLFRGKYNFMSNFYYAPIVYSGKEYLSVEHAYHCFKTDIEALHERIRTTMNAKEAKSFTRGIPRRKDWFEINLPLMEDLVKAKFDQHPDLKEKLLSTGDIEIVEHNIWHENYFGDCVCGRKKCKHQGENHLGKILMKIRKNYRKKKIHIRKKGIYKDE